MRKTQIQLPRGANLCGIVVTCGLLVMNLFAMHYPARAQQPQNQQPQNQEPQAHQPTAGLFAAPGNILFAPGNQPAQPAASSMFEPAAQVLPVEFLTVPPGYPSGYPGPSTDEGSPIGRGPSRSNSPADSLFAAPELESIHNTETLVTPEGVIITESPPLTRRGAPPGVKPGIVQAANLTATYLPDLANDGFQVLDLEHSITFGFPLPSRESPLLVSPGFDVHLLSGPASPNLPSALYDTYLSVRWLRKISERWMLNAAVIPGWYSDWQTGSDEALRVPAQIFGIYECTPQLKVILGVVYLDREDVNFLPAAGLIYAPNEDTRWEIVMPRPRYYRRIRACETFEEWFSIAGEFGGGQWAIQDPSGANDVLSARDYRVLLGWERKSLNGGLGARVDFGYVFARTYEFESGIPDYEPGDTLFVRVGTQY
jgi:hypothetical protein